MIIQEEKWTPEFYAEIAVLTEASNEEVTPEGGILNLDLVSYFTYEQLGILKAVAARTDDGEMVGYMTFFLGNDPHKKHRLIGKLDSVFLIPEYRKGFTGIKIMKEAERIMVENECDGVVMASSVHRDLTPIYKRLGYKPIETIFYKELGGDE